MRKTRGIHHNKIKTKCRQCGAQVKRWPSQMKRTKFGPFCDKDCLGKWRSLALVGPLGANFQNGVKWDRGYQRVHAPWHPFKDKSGYVSLHRLLVEARRGEYLSADLVVHHRDGDPSNNHWDNLEAIKQADHAREHIDNGTVVRNRATGRLERAMQ